MRILKRITVALAVVTVMLVFAQRINADEMYRTINIFYCDTSSDGGFAGFPIDVYGSFSEEQAAWFIYGNLFEHYNTDKLPFIEEGTELLDVKIEEGHLIINVSRNILNYSAGTAYQMALVDTILENAKQLEGVTRVSLLIEGRREYLPEGLSVSEMEVWRN